MDILKQVLFPTKYFQLLNNEKIRKYLILTIGTIGLFLIMLSELLPATEKRIDTYNHDEENESYILSMESKLVKLVEQVSGAGKCHIMLTLEQGTQYVFASESKKIVDETQSKDGTVGSTVQQKDNSENRIVILEENGISRPLVETSREPQVKGVVVVCDGGSSSIVRQRVTEVITTVLGIGSHQVCVVPGK